MIYNLDKFFFLYCFNIKIAVENHRLKIKRTFIRSFIFRVKMFVSWFISITREQAQNTEKECRIDDDGRVIEYSEHIEES